MTSSKHKGFTLIELSLVMGFLSVLLVAIILTTLQMGKLYTKGETNRTINRIGRDLNDSLRRDFLAASSQRIVITTPTGSGTALSGRLCLGTVSYVWNTADLLNISSASMIKKNGQPVVFERVVDASNKLCTVQASGTYITDIPVDMPSTSILASEGRTLAIYDISINNMAADADNGLYDIKLTVGTVDPSVTQRDVNLAVTCRPPTDNSSDFNYCSVADFDIIVRTGGDGR